MNNRKYTLLTPSARSAFEEMKKDYENALLDKAIEIANHHPAGDVEISLRDIVEAQNNIGFTRNEFIRFSRKERLYTTGLFAGFSYVVIGLVMYFATNGTVSLADYLDVKYLWIVIVVMGIVFMIVPLGINFDRIAGITTSRYADGSFSAYTSPDTVVRMWNIIEKKGAELMRLRGMDTDSSIKAIYEFLVHEFNNHDYIEMLNDVIMMRNQIVHTDAVQFKKEDIVKVLNQSQTIINELDKKVKEISN